MVQLILALTVFGILAFLVHVFGGGDFIRGVARVDNKTEVIATPIFNGKTVSADLQIVNNNSFDISNMRMRCGITRRSGTTQKSISKKIEQTVKANSSIVINNFYITNVRDFPKSIECRIAAFDRSTAQIGAGVAQDTKKDFRKMDIK
jgi:hypothetical protein